MALAEKVVIVMIEKYDTLFPDGPPKVQKKLSEEELKKLQGTVNITLDDMLTTPFMLKFFREYCMENFQQENIEYYLAVKDYEAKAKQSGSPDPTLAMEIYNNYVKKNAPSEVNISDRERDATSGPFETGGELVLTGHEFDKTVETIYKLMELNSYIRFKKSKYFDHCVTYRVARMTR